MKRDMDLIRKLGLAIEAATDHIDSSNLAIDEFTPEQIGYHLVLMTESKLIVSVNTSTLGSTYPEMLITRLTSLGHDFVDAARNDTVWKKATAAIRTTVGTTTIAVLLEYLKAELRKTLGLGGAAP